MRAQTAAAADRPRRVLPVAREGYPFILGSAGVACGLWLAGFHVLGGVAALVAVFVTSFFRDPERVIPPGEQYIVAPADGRVIAVGPVDEGRYLNAPATKISIFMSPLNVHVNRVPLSGTVEAVRYHPGKYFRAFAEKASLDNEQNAVVVRDRLGRRVCFVQIAGFIARRIVCYAQEHSDLERGARYGLIMFGSRADIYLPPEARVCVAVGDRTRGAETVVAEWPT